MQSGSNLRSSDRFRFSASDLGGLGVAVADGCNAPSVAMDATAAIAPLRAFRLLIFFFFSLRCIAISTLGFVNQLPRRFRRTKRELSSSQSEYLSQTLFPSTVIPNIPSRLNHDSCFYCMMCKRSGGGAASQAETWPVWAERVAFTATNMDRTSSTHR